MIRNSRDKTQLTIKYLTKLKSGGALSVDEVEEINSLLSHLDRRSKHVKWHIAYRVVSKVIVLLITLCRFQETLKDFITFIG